MFQGGFGHLFNLVLTRYECRDLDLVQHVKGIKMSLSWGSKLRLECKSCRSVWIPKLEV